VLLRRGWFQVLNVFTPKCTQSLAAALFNDLCGPEQLVTFAAHRIESRVVELKVVANNTTGRTDDIAPRKLDQFRIVRRHPAPISFKLQGIVPEDGSIRITDGGDSSRNSPFPAEDFEYELKLVASGVRSMPLLVTSLQVPHLPSVSVITHHVRTG